MKRLVPILIIALIVAVVVFRNQLIRRTFAPTPTNIVESTPSARAEKEDIEIIAQNLKVPWEIAFLPDKTMLVTERTGNLLRVDRETHIIQTIEGVKATGEGGLLGLAVHPTFGSNHVIYLYLTSQENGKLVNRVERYVLLNNRLSDRMVIFSGIAGSSLHDGGRIAFGPDGFLYITTGDATNEKFAQDKQSLNGKILRIKDDGSIPSDNPFGSAVYSYGHRNAQGLVWDTQGRLWATEHGPSGLQSGFDEVNLIEKGKNYGWPVVKGDQTALGMVSPVIQSGASDTWAPAGVAFWDGSLFFGGLRGEALYEAKITGEKLTLSSHFKGRFGRIRAVGLGPDGFLYLSTSNTDGRGTVQSGDDKIIRLNPTVFR
ncbi:PQQ-dependent sugar dehydrogenase [Candidatus Gottesmanbacteria bacterium]|nr:PQQ-dependent sugar dehydrogenase [Candidatus Gottesmanbacteria bacterium]